MAERWEELLAEYLEIRDEGASSEERRSRPTICLADACQRIAELEKERKALEFELLGVMHSVDKWLPGYVEGDAEKHGNQVHRAAMAREAALKEIEAAEKERNDARSIISRAHGALADCSTVPVPSSLDGDLVPAIEALMRQRDIARSASSIAVAQSEVLRKERDDLRTIVSGKAMHDAAKAEREAIATLVQRWSVVNRMTKPLYPLVCEIMGRGEEKTDV